MVPPDGMTAQRRRALNNANRIKTGRRMILNHISSLPMPESLEEIADALEDPPDVLWSLQIVALLMAGRHVGVGKARVMLRKAGVGGMPIDGYTPVSELTRRQREALMQVLRARAREVRENRWP